MKQEFEVDLRSALLSHLNQPTKAVATSAHHKPGNEIERLSEQFSLTNDITPDDYHITGKTTASHDARETKKKI